MWIEYAFNLNGNESRKITDSLDCFNCNDELLKKYIMISGEDYFMKSVTPEDVEIGKYRSKTRNEVNELFNIDVLEKIPYVEFNIHPMYLVQYINEIPVKYYLSFSIYEVSAEAQYNAIINALLTSDEKISLADRLEALPNISRLRRIFYSPKEEGNWIYLRYNMDGE